MIRLFQMLIKKNVIFIFISMAFIVLILNGCKNNKNTDIADTVKINFSYLGRDAEINEKTDIDNIIYIISQMKKRPAGEDADSGQIKGYFTLEKGMQVPFKITDHTIVIGNFEYYTQVFYDILWKVFSDYIYDIGFIIDKLNKGNMTKLTAKDTGDLYILNDPEKSELTKLLSNFKPIETGSGLFIEYPFYEIFIETGNNSTVKISIADNGSIAIEDNLICSYYGSTDDLWIYVSALLPVEKSKDKNSILYLFNYSKLTVNNTVYKGEYVYRVTVRVLVEEIEETEEIGSEYTETSEKIELVFTIYDETYNVDIYENYFTYLGNRYVSPGIYNKIVSALSTG